MKGHYTFLGEFGLNDSEQKIASAFILFAVLFLVGLLVGGKLKSKEQKTKALIPSNKLTLLSFFDFFVESFINFHDSILGKHNRKYVGFTCSIFMFLLFGNLLGLVPGMAALTTTVQVNVGISIVVFIYFNYLGVRTHGIKNYLAHFCGPMPALALLIFPVEIFGIILRPITLNLRLYWNVTADHLVLGIFTDEVIKGFGLLGMPFYALGTFVAFMQAFIFTTLTIVYILFATQHEEH
jgi:F-type H+-transporting ATPase subunit a